MAEWACLDAYCAYRARPGVQGQGNGAGKTVNSQGFISTPEINFAKEPSEVRIAFLGGSSTAGMGVNLADDQTWPSQAVGMIQQRLPDKKITFINAALGGYSSFESYGRLWSRVRFFEPDIAVVYHGWNELNYFRNANKVRHMRTRPDGSWTFKTTRFVVCEPMWIDHIARYSQILSHLRRKYGAKESGEIGGAGPRILANDFDSRAVEVWRTNLQLLRETARTLHVELFVCKQATLVVSGLDEQQQERCRYAIHGFGHDPHVRAFEAIYQAIDQEIPASRVIDVTSMSGKAEFFHDSIHPTEEGATKIAAIVAQRLVEYLENH